MRLFSFFSHTQKRYQFLHLLAGILLLATMVSSCITTKSNYYFKTLAKDTSISAFVAGDFDTKIQKKDILLITASSLSKEMDDRFNIGAGYEDVTKIQAPSGFMVDEKGMILVHFLGNIKVEGFTRKELKEKLQNELTPYMKEPIVTVQYLNHKVTILGEIEKPQVINMPEEKMSLIDIIVLSGDLKENGSRKDIMVIRELGSEKKIKHINLEDHSIFSSPWYYVQPNDIIYISPDNEKYMKEEKKRNLQTTLSLVASGISLLVIILNTLLR